MKAIDIVKTPHQRLLEAVEEQAAADALEVMEAERAINKADSRVLAKELYNRGFKLKDVFSVYIELEEAGNGRSIDVEDTLLTAELQLAEPATF